MWAQYLLSLGAVAAALLMRALLDPLLGVRAPYITVLAVLLPLLMVVRTGPYLAASAASLVGSWYLFVDHRYSFNLAGPIEAVHLLLMALALTAASVTSWIVTRSQDRVREAQQQTEAQREALRVTLTSIGDAVVTTDPRGKITFLNRVAADLLGWAPEQACNRPLSEVFRIVNEQTRRPVENPVEKVLAHGKIVGLANHTVLLRPDGTERPIDDSAAPIRDAKGNIIGVVLVFRDITERRRVESAMSHVAAIVESSDDAIISKSLDGTILSWNHGAERLFGYSADEAVGKSINLIIPNDMRDEERSILQRLRAGEHIDHFETVRVARDGRRVTISLTVSPLRDQSGQIIGASKVARDITDRKHSEQRIAGLSDDLRRRVEELDALLNVLPVGVFVAHDANCTRMTMNPAGAKMLGISPETNPSKTAPPGAGLPFRVLRNGVEVSVDDLPMQRAVRTGEAVWGEVLEVERADRSLVTLFEYAIPLFDQAGKVRGCLGAFVDITERKEIEQALARRAAEQTVLYQFTDRLHRAGSIEEVYDAAIDSILSALNCQRASILLYDNAGVMRFVAWRGLSDGYRQVVEGHSPWQRDQTNPQPVCINDVDASDLPHELKDIIRNEQIRAMAFIPLVVNRILIGKFMVYYSQPHAFSDAELALAQTIARQLAFAVQRQRSAAEQREAERALREGEQRLRLATQAGKVGVWDWEIPVNRVSWTDSLYAMHGLRSGEFAGTVEAFSTLVHPGDREMVAKAIDGALNADEPYELEFRAVRPDGKIVWLFTNAVVVRDDSGRPFRMIGATVDMTERKLAEQQLLESNRRKDEFLAMLAHELRNPLAPIRNSLEIIKRARDDAALLAHARDMLDRQVSQMERLVDDLLDASRITRNRLELRKQHIELASVIHQAVEACRPLAESLGHEVTVNVPVEPIYLNGDPARLAQVFGNLLNNACKYTDPPGCIILSTERQGSDVVVSVRDNGVGIPPDMVNRVFDMFIQVDRTLERTGGGLGIGLALVRQLVQMHQGTVEAHSEGEGKGSEFIVRLPILIREAPAEPPQQPAAPEIPSTATRRILVVDDNHDSAESLAKLLALCGHHTETAHDGVEAVEKASSYDPDMVLLDIGLPRMNGYDACREIRRRLSGRKPVMVALTGWGQAEDRSKSKEAGFDAHLVKPVNYDALKALVESLSSSEPETTTA